MTNENNKLSAPMGINHPSIGNLERVLLDALKVAPERFQVRNSDSNNYVNKVLKQQEEIEMVRKLVSVVHEGKLLDPLLVWEDRSNGELLVIDGHHRMEAYQESELAPSTLVWIQRVNVETESQARHIAFETNSRLHLNMSQPERMNEVWLGILTDEITGSVRDIERQYGVAKSSVARMRDKAEEVITQLQKDAEMARELFSTLYIRANAPLWKKLAEWRDSDESGKVDVDELEQNKIMALVRSLTIKFGTDVRANPELLLKAFMEFYEQATGNPLDILVANRSAIDENEDF